MNTTKSITRKSVVEAPVAQSNGYPFETKTQIRARIESDDRFVLMCVLIVQSRQTASEQEQGVTIESNKKGWMSSHAIKGTEFARMLVAKEELTAEQMGEARDMVRMYTKQIAAHLRCEVLRSNPKLREQAKVFGITLRPTKN